MPAGLLQFANLTSTTAVGRSALFALTHSNYKLLAFVQSALFAHVNIASTSIMSILFPKSMAL